MALDREAMKYDHLGFLRRTCDDREKVWGDTLGVHNTVVQVPTPILRQLLDAVEASRTLADEIEELDDGDEVTERLFTLAAFARALEPFRGTS